MAAAAKAFTAAETATVEATITAALCGGGAGTGCDEPKAHDGRYGDPNDAMLCWLSHDHQLGPTSRQERGMAAA